MMWRGEGHYYCGECVGLSQSQEEGDNGSTLALRGSMNDSFHSSCSNEMRRKNQPVVTFPIFKWRKRRWPWRWRTPVPARDTLTTSLHNVFLVLFLILMFQVPFTTQKGSNHPSNQQSSSSSFSSSPPRLIFANRRDIRIIDFYYRGGGANIRGNTSVVVNDLTEATALDILYRLGVVCWSDMESEKIQCSSFNQTATQSASPALPFSNSKTTIVSETVLAPEDLVCDYVTGNLYWTDSETNRVEVVSIYPPFNRKVLIWDDIDQPRALALAPNLG
ncbi:unnamed protein product [Orchesella dallaii]|uniref:Low-density lipoprotein receptor-related protein 6 n=1 Tax=Orchesella dallaii TaxID=48710 RepID=A0ABP1R1H1_9HEXA